MSDLPVGTTDPLEPVPSRLRILASAENLGTLRSIHQPATWSTRIQFRQGRIYLFDGGLVLGQARRTLRLFRFGQFTARKAGSGYLITGPDGRAMGLSKNWTGFAELQQAITAITANTGQGR